jgi:hypothetical protein
LSSARETEKRWRYSSFDTSAVEYQSAGNGVTTEAEESPLLRSVTRKRLVKEDLESILAIFEVRRSVMAL